MIRPLVPLVFLAISPAAAQQDSAPIDAGRLVTEGQGDSARALVRARLAAVAPSDSTYPEILYTAGLVAEDVDSALAYLRIVAFDYSQSDWADRALLRIAQLAYASGDFATTIRMSQRVLMDYPFSTVRSASAFWAGRAHLELGETADGCDLLSLASDSAGAEVEVANRARFYLQRCERALATAGDSAAPEPARPRAPLATRVYSVQIAAVRSAASADEAMRTLRSSGYEPHVIRDADGFLKVRVGRLDTRAAASRLAAELKRKFEGEPFVVEEP